MGLAIIGMCIYLSFPLMLLVFLIVYILRNGKKEGFLKTIKSKTALVTIVLIFMCVGFFIFSFIPRSENQLFEGYILKPIPESIEVLDSFDGRPNFYPDECLHFKISPADFQLILAAKNWQTASEGNLGGFQCGDVDSHWYFSFTPPSFGNNVVTYTFIPREKDIEVMFVNSQMNEVYYFYHDGNLP
ncbi:MAG: hypothetical protein AB9891_06515 [Anaerolineaceae bacterium]